MLVFLAPLAVIIGAAAGLWALYLMYSALNASLRSGKLKKTPLPVRVLSYLLIAVMGTADVLFNVTLGSLLFLEPPSLRLPRRLGEIHDALIALTFTHRCSSHLGDQGWRGDIARWVCNDWLNPFEEGHCK